MNKDVVYIEPEDDITDIITKIENAKEKIVALVLPDKAEIFHSAVNTKLVAKAGLNANKNVVLVTTDPAIVKLAAIARLPITKDLKTVPKLPSIDGEESKIVVIKEESSEEKPAEDEAAEEAENTEEEEESEEAEEESKPEEEKAEEEETRDTEESEKPENKAEAKEEDKKKPAEKPEKAKKDKKAAGKKSESKGFFKKHKVIIILTPIFVIALAAVLYWAFAIAPAVDIKFTIRTVKNNFSENVTFTTKIEEENAKEGKFYLAEKKQETPIKVEFKATGSKNIGEKATGDVVVYVYFSGKGAKNIPVGTSFSINGLFYTATAEATLSWDSKSFDPCENGLTLEKFTAGEGCLITASVPITASGSGASYNVAASISGWSTNAGVGVYSVSDISGGTDRTVTVVQQSDIDAAVSSISNPTNTNENRASLLSSIGEDSYKIESSFRQDIGEIVSSPALDEVVEEGVTPTITTKITSSIFTIDLTKVKEYISEAARVDEKNRIYELGDPFVESFTSIEGGYAGRLKATYTVGSNISAQTVLEKVQGIRIGEVRPILSDYGARDIEVNPSFPWVNTVPNDPNKITIEIVTKE